MTQLKSYIRLFLFLGILFALTSVALSVFPKTTNTLNDNHQDVVKDLLHDFKKTNTTVNFDNADFGTLAAAIISATCFIVAGNLIKYTNKP